MKPSGDVLPCMTGCASSCALEKLKQPNRLLAAPSVIMGGQLSCRFIWAEISSVAFKHQLPCVRLGQPLFQDALPRSGLYPGHSCVIKLSTASKPSLYLTLPPLCLQGTTGGPAFRRASDGLHRADAQPTRRSSAVPRVYGCASEVVRSFLFIDPLRDDSRRPCELHTADHAMRHT